MKIDEKKFKASLRELAEDGYIETLIELHNQSKDERHRKMIRKALLKGIRKMGKRGEVIRLDQLLRRTDLVGCEDNEEKGAGDSNIFLRLKRLFKRDLEEEEFRTIVRRSAIKALSKAIEVCAKRYSTQMYYWFLRVVPHENIPIGAIKKAIKLCGKHRRIGPIMAF